tara:strand:+ start:150 stop:437 length:288 start_codon:yes stop_codon:yes gene_type:complete
MGHGPAHYKRGNVEVWDFIRDQELDYFLGNAIKYICRAGYKDSKEEDLKKAIHYLENELHHVQKSDGSSGRVPQRVFPLMHRPEWDESDPEIFDR